MPQQDLYKALRSGKPVSGTNLVNPLTANPVTGFAAGQSGRQAATRKSAQKKGTRQQLQDKEMSNSTATKVAINPKAKKTIEFPSGRSYPYDGTPKNMDAIIRLEEDEIAFEQGKAGTTIENKDSLSHTPGGRTTMFGNEVQNAVSGPIKEAVRRAPNWLAQMVASTLPASAFIPSDQRTNVGRQGLDMLANIPGGIVASPFHVAGGLGQLADPRSTGEERLKGGTEAALELLVSPLAGRLGKAVKGAKKPVAETAEQLLAKMDDQLGPAALDDLAKFQKAAGPKDAKSAPVNTPPKVDLGNADKRYNFTVQALEATKASAKKKGNHAAVAKIENELQKVKSAYKQSISPKQATRKATKKSAELLSEPKVFKTSHGEETLVPANVRQSIYKMKVDELETFISRHADDPDPMMADAVKLAQRKLQNHPQASATKPQDLESTLKASVEAEQAKRGNLSLVQGGKPSAPAKVAAKTPVKEAGSTRQFMLGGQEGARATMRFASKEQERLYDLGAAQKGTVRNRGRTQDSTVINKQTERLKNATPEDLAKASQVYDDVRAQMKGATDGETRLLKENQPAPLAKTPVASLGPPKTTTVEAPKPSPSAGASQLKERAVQHLGTTKDPREAGYILDDGQTLDFSGKRQGGESGVRYMDHRELPEELELGPGSGTEKMHRFMNKTGAVRVSLHSGDSMAANFNKPLTPSQMAWIERHGEGLDLTIEASNPATGYPLKTIAVDKASRSQIVGALRKLNKTLEEISAPAVPTSKAMEPVNGLKPGYKVSTPDGEGVVRSTVGGKITVDVKGTKKGYDPSEVTLKSKKVGGGSANMTMDNDVLVAALDRARDKGIVTRDALVKHMGKLANDPQAMKVFNEWASTNKIGTTAAKGAARARPQKQQQKPADVSVGAKVRATVKAVRLANPVNRAMDVASNTLSNAAEQGVSTFDGAFDRLLFPKARKADGAASGVQWAFARQALKGAPRRWAKEFKSAMTKGDPETLAKYNMVEAPGPLKYVQRATGTTDIPFRDYVYNATKAELKRINPKLTADAIDDIATEEAARAVFMGDTWFTKVWDGLESGVKNGAGEPGMFLLDQLAPFTRVISNVAGRTFDYAGAGLAKGAAKTVRGAITKSLTVAERREINRLMSRGLVGTGLMYTGAKLYDKGLVQPTELNKKYGYVDWGNKFGVWKPDQLGPAAAVVLMGAAVQAIKKSGLTEKQKGSMLTKLMAETPLNTPAVTGTKRIGEVTRDPAGTVNKMAAGALIPSIVNTIAEVMDLDGKGQPVKRDIKPANDDDIVGRLTGPYKKRIPGVRNRLPIRKD